MTLSSNTPGVHQSVAAWLRHKAQYTASLSMSTVRMELESGNLSRVIYALARIAEREECGRSDD